MRIPIYENQVNVNPTPSSEGRTPNVVPAAFDGGVAASKQALDKAGEGLGESGEKMGLVLQEHLLRENYYREKEQADDFAVKFSQELNNKAYSTDQKTITGSDGKEYQVPDGWFNRKRNAADKSYDEYVGYSNDLKNKYLQNISNTRVQRNFIKNIDTTIKTYGNAIAKHQATEYNEASKDGLDTWISSEILKYPLMSNEDKNKSVVGVQERIKEQYARGVLNYSEAEKRKDDFYNTLVKGDIYNDTSTQETDSNVLTDLKKGNSGKYFFLPESQRLKLIEESQKRIFQNNQTFKRVIEVSQNQRNNTFIDKLASGTATFKDIDAEFSIPESLGGMKRNVLDQYQRRLQSGVTNDLNLMLREKASDKNPTTRSKMVKEYNDLIDMFIDDTGDQWKAKEALAKGYADGNLDAKELKILTPIKDNLKDIEFNRNTSPVALAIKEVKKWMKSSNATDEELAFRTKQLLSGIGSGEKPQEVVKKIMDSEMLKHFPDYTTYTKEGRVKKDNASGRLFVVYPDGSWNWKEEKAKSK